jgi:dihydrofolate reductase
MRKVIVAAFMSLDGVMQAPGGPEEDPSGGFEFGGWAVPHIDEAVGAAIGEGFASGFDLLIGRRTYEIFAAHWPHVATDPGAAGYDSGDAEIAVLFNRVTKNVATGAPERLTWENSRALRGDVASAVRELKREAGPDLLVQGSSELVQALLAADLVDVLRLFVCPLLLGRGKRLFGDGTRPAALTLTASATAPSGVQILTYAPAGSVKRGSFALDEPSPAEIERRERLTREATVRG